MSETGAMPGDAHFIDWGLLEKQILSERRRLLAAADAAVTAAGLRGWERGVAAWARSLSCLVHTPPPDRFTVRVGHELLAGQDIFESYLENERDCAHIHETPTPSK